jgi:hypothetical protein
VEAEPSLWTHPEATLGEIEDGLITLELPVVDTEALARRWASLVAQAFGGVDR